MAKQNRKGWLDKISKWILDVFPGDREHQQDTPSTPANKQPKADPKTPSTSVPRPQPEAARSLSDRPQTQKIPRNKTEPAVEPHPPSSAPATEPSSDKTLIKAWKAFEHAWQEAGLSIQFFLESDELTNTLAVLDKTFEDELIEWLFQLCTKPEALRNLAAIIERGQVRPTDNVDSIRAFAYVSVAIRSRPIPQASRQTDHSQVSKYHPDPELGQAPKQPFDNDQAQEPGSPQITSQPPSTSAATSHQVASLEQEQSGIEAREGIPNQAIEELGLSLRTYNSLKRSEIHTLLDLAGKTEENLLGLKNFGDKSVNEVIDSLEKLGLGLPFLISDISGQQRQSVAENANGTHAGPDRIGELKDHGLSARTLNCLHRGKVYSIAELISCTQSDLLSFPNLGPTSLEEIRSALTGRGFTLAVPSSIAEAGDERDVESIEIQTEEAWDQLKQKAVENYATSFLSHEQLGELVQNTPQNPASNWLNELLIRLHAVVNYLTDNVSLGDESLPCELQPSITALKEVLFGRLLGESLVQAQAQTNRLSRSLTEANIRNWRVYLQRCTGKTLTSIADDNNPPVSRERVRQMEAKIIKAVGIKPIDLVSTIKESQTAGEDAAELVAIQDWMTCLERLPISTDKEPSEAERSYLWDQVIGMNLKERLKLLAKHKIAPSSQEYDYHYTYVTARTGPVGTGYWREFENLKQFVIRHAAAIGAPNVMPNQTSFPDSVRGVVTSYGGQSKVAMKIGLEYHGQLVGEDGGRTYWTEDKLAKLLLDINSHLGLPEDLMPSYGQVLEFFAISQEPPYQDKKPHSAIAALTKMGKFHWSEVAKRFNKRFISGESQKAVTISYIKAFVRDLGEHLDSLTPSELFVLFQAQGINRGEREKFSRTFDALVDAVQSGMVDKDQLRSWADNNEVATINDLLELGVELKEEATLEKREQLLLERRSKQLNSEFPESETTADLSVEDLPTLEPKAVLKALDKAVELVESSSSDGDKVEFLKAKATAKLWDACFRDEQALIRKLRMFQTSTDSYSYEVRQAFLEEYEGAKSLNIPPSYAFRDLKGIPREPKLMQRLVAYRLLITQVAPRRASRAHRLVRVYQSDHVAQCHPVPERPFPA